MKLLFDTQILIWAGSGSRQLSREATALLEDRANLRLFSALSVAEVAIKTARGRPSFNIPPDGFRQLLLDNWFEELALTGAHARRLVDLPLLHKDPFDRLLVAQAIAEGLTLVTSDALLGRYSARVMVV